MRHWYDVLLVVIALLRPIRLLRLLALGRIFAVALMLVGISSVGVVAASVAAWLISNVERPASSPEER